MEDKNNSKKANGKNGKKANTETRKTIEKFEAPVEKRNDNQEAAHNHGKDVTNEHDDSYYTRAFRDLNTFFAGPALDMFKAMKDFTNDNPAFGLGNITSYATSQAKVYYDDNGDVTIRVDLPGRDKKNVHVSWPDNATVRINVEEQENTPDHSYRNSQIIERSLRAEVDVESATATLKDGVLTIRTHELPAAKILETKVL